MSVQFSSDTPSREPAVERPEERHHKAENAPPPKSLRGLVASGVAWTFATSIVIQAARVVFAIALARFLTPEEYGIASMALVFAALVATFSDLSLGVGLVQRAVISEEDRSTVFWTTTGLGLATTLVGLAASAPVARFYGEPAVQGLFAAVSLSIGIGALGATHAALLQREMAFRSISLRVGISTLLGGSAGVGLAALGFGAWALIVQQLCVSAVSTVLLWMSMPWRPRLLYSTRSLRELGAFGGAVFGVRLGDYARTNADKLFVGRVLGSAALGTYSVAFNLVLGPVSRFIVAILDTLLPAFSRLQHDVVRLRGAWVAANRVIAALLLPALMGLVIVAPDFVRVVLSSRWAGVAPLLQLLTVGILVQALTALGVEVLKAQGRAGTVFRFSFCETIALVMAVALAVPYGVERVALAYTLSHVPSRGYLLWLTCRTLGVSMVQLMHSLRGVLEATAGMAAACGCALVALADASPAIRLSATVVVGIAVYVPICVWRGAELRSDLVRFRQEARR